jgi:hypothetical protein
LDEPFINTENLSFNPKKESKGKLTKPTKQKKTGKHKSGINNELKLDLDEEITVSMEISTNKQRENPGN